MKALVIGYGSIGKRHAKILQNMEKIDSVTVLSSQPNVPFEIINRIEEIININPDYIIIASNTSLHYKQLQFLEETFKDKTILVEKPLFDCLHDYTIVNNKVFVAYNFRFHPMLSLIKEKTKGKKLWNINVFAGSYLPDWRPGRDYQTTYSAIKNAGGGVLLDLSHELDYVQFMAGEIEIGYTINEKVSNLEIETDDLLLLSGKTEKCSHIHISLNYFTRQSFRKIIIDGESISIQADLKANTVSLYEDSKKREYSWPSLERNSTYEAEHNAVVSGDYSKFCTYEEGIKTLQLIEKIKSFEIT